MGTPVTVCEYWVKITPSTVHLSSTISALNLMYICRMVPTCKGYEPYVIEVRNFRKRS